MLSTGFFVADLLCVVSSDDEAFEPNSPLEFGVWACDIHLSICNASEVCVKGGIITVHIEDIRS
jgi:hypothetical protein